MCAQESIKWIICELTNKEDDACMLMKTTRGHFHNNCIEIRSMLQQFAKNQSSHSPPVEKCIVAST